MVDPTLQVLQAYMSALRNNVVVDGFTFPVYTGKQPNEEGGDVIILNADVTQVPGGKREFDSEVSVLIDIITRFTSGGTYARAIKAASEVLKIVAPRMRENELDFGGIQHIRSEFRSMNQLHESTDNGEIFRKLIRVSHFVHE